MRRPQRALTSLLLPLCISAVVVVTLTCDHPREPQNLVISTASPGGTYIIIGEQLARMEARVAFEELLARIPAYELASEPRWPRSTWARAYRAAPTTLLEDGDLLLGGFFAVKRYNIGHLR